MVHRVEELDDLPLDFHRVGNGNLTVLEVPDRLGNDRLAVSGRAVNEHRVSGGDRRPELVEHLLTDHEMRERVADACARNRPGDGATIRLEVFAILPQRHRRHADVLVVLQKQQRPPAALVCDPVPVRGPSDHRAAEDFALVRALQEIEHGLDYRELQPDSVGKLQTCIVGCEMHHLQHELGEEIVAQPRLFERARRRRM